MRREVADARAHLANESGKRMKLAEELKGTETEIRDLKSKLDMALKENEASKANCEREKEMGRSSTDRLEKDLKLSKEEKQKYEHKCEMLTEQLREVEKEYNEQKLKVDHLQLAQYSWKKRSRSRGQL